MNEKLKSESVDQLFKGILQLQTVEECYSFFEDLCTIGELVSMSQRFEVAKMLKEGQTYLAISAKTVTDTSINEHSSLFLSLSAILCSNLSQA